MPFVVVLLGVLLVIAAFNNAHGDLGTAFKQDVPGFFKWGAALGAILALGFVPGLKTPSRYLVALVLLVIFLHNYQKIVDGFKNFAGSSGTASGSPAQTPTAAFTASAGQSTDAPAQTLIAGDAGSGASGSTPGQTAGSQIAGGVNAAGSLATQFASGSINPSSLLSTVESGFGGAFGVG